MRKPSVKVSDQEIINAVELCNGNYRLAAQKLRIDYGTLIRRAKHNPEIERAKLDACADMVTVAEDNIYNEILNGNYAASKFVLERLARDKWGSQPQQIMVDSYPEPIGD